MYNKTFEPARYWANIGYTTDEGEFAVVSSFPLDRPSAIKARTPFQLSQNAEREHLLAFAQELEPGTETTISYHGMQIWLRHINFN